MSTIAERMAAAAGRVTGTPPDTPTGRRVIDTGDYRIETVRDAYSRRHTFRATAFRQDSAGRLIAAEDATDWTSIGAMATTMRSAARRARTLTIVSDTLTAAGWCIDPMIPHVGSGITAMRGQATAYVYSDGDVRSGDREALAQVRAAVEDAQREG